MQTNVYLDIDGVLLANDLNPANYVHEFLEKVTSTYPTYWLTTHCKGDAGTAINRLSLVFPPETMALLKDVKATNWDLAKTEAIDFSKPFLWFDDDLFYEEKQDLLSHDRIDNCVEVDLKKDPNHLRRFITSFPIAVSEVKQTELQP